MHTLTVRVGEKAATIAVESRESVREILDTTGLRVRAACGGSGSCGACTVRLVGGHANPPTLAEYLKLTAEERAGGMRLACQLRLTGDAEILLEHPAPASPWKSISPEDLPSIEACLPELQEHVLGVAIDLGTTHIRLSLWDRRQGRRIATRSGGNPQSIFGADVLNRLAAARDAGRAAELRNLARGAILDALHDMLARDVGEVTPMLAEIGHVVLAGNTAMLALLTGRGGNALLDPENWQQPIDCQPLDQSEWRSLWRLPNAHLEVLPGVAGFVGSDLMADLLATGLADGPPGALLVDIGTNTEIALWDGEVLHVTSVPGGPAFESGGIGFGMPAEFGAICAVRRGGAAAFELEVIGGGAPAGFCGSGLLDAIAVLLKADVIKPSGRIATEYGTEGYRLDPANPRTSITGMAIDAFQRAKAATAAAVTVLMAQAAMPPERVGRLVVCGAFGRHLDVANARNVGLLPDLPDAAVELFGNAALAGCEEVLLGRQGRERLAELAGKLSLINVTLVLSFENIYIEELRLRRIPITG